MPVRGFKRQNTHKGIKQPNLSRPTITGGRVAGAPRIPSAKLRRVEPYPPLPPWWGNSLNEWIVHARLIYVDKFILGIDVLEQPALNAPGLNGKDFNRADFLLTPWGKNGVPDGFFPKGVVINPISDFTHPSKAKDKIERMILGNAGYREVFIDQTDLLTQPALVIEAARRGRDLSSRGSG